MEHVVIPHPLMPPSHAFSLKVLVVCGYFHLLLGMATNPLGRGADSYGMGVALLLFAAYLLLSFQNMVAEVYAETEAELLEIIEKEKNE